MSEQRWDKSRDPAWLIHQLGEKMTIRKHQLFAVASFRQLVWHLLDETNREVLVTCERFMEGEVDQQVIIDTLVSQYDEEDQAPQDVLSHWLSHYLEMLLGDFADETPLWKYHRVWEQIGLILEGEQLIHEGAGIEMLEAWEDAWLGSGCPQIWTGRDLDTPFCDLLREQNANPFRPIDFDDDWRKWNDGAVVKLAEQFYSSQQFTEMPILADALEDAGCNQSDILNHCREERTHVRGCWVLDLILDRE